MRLVAIAGLIGLLGVGCTSAEAPDPTVQPQAARDNSELDAAVKRLIAAPIVTAAEGLVAEVLVPPGLMYDPLTILPHGDVVWVNDDGREAGERGGRIYAIDKGGTVSVLVDTPRLLPPTGFDVAPDGFGTFGGHIFTVSQPRSTTLGTRRNHVITRVDPNSSEPAELFCTLPNNGTLDGGAPGGGLDARFGPAGSPFANRLFAVTIFNGTVYEITAGRQCRPFAALDGKPWTRPSGITFTADGSKMLMTVSRPGTPVLSGDLAPPAPGGILSIAPNGTIDPTPVRDGIERGWSIAVAPPDFPSFGGQIFFTTSGQAVPVGSPKGNGRLYRVTPDRSVQVVAEGFFRPTGIGFVDDSIWVAEIKGDFIPGQQLPDGVIVRIKPR